MWHEAGWAVHLCRQSAAFGGSWVRLRHLLFHENSFFFKSPNKLKVNYLREISFKAAH